MKKTVLSLLLIGAVLVGLLSGCTVKEESSGKTLVVYFSATGTTEKIAGMIAEATGGDLFALEPVDPYTDEDLDWTDIDSRVNKEHDNESERAVELVSTTIDGFQDASVVYVGYPIWWGIAACPINDFIKNNDFSGKTVIPFCTAASSDIGNSAALLSDMAGSGEWLPGRRFYANSSAGEINNWIKSLDI